jgi:hypothetical protein
MRYLQLAAPATVNGSPINVSQTIAGVISPLTNQLITMGTSIQNLNAARNKQILATASQNTATVIPTYT